MTWHLKPELSWIPNHPEDRRGSTMANRKSSRVNREYKKKYRVRNWGEYERGLKRRGDVTI